MKSIYIIVGCFLVSFSVSYYTLDKTNDKDKKQEEIKIKNEQTEKEKAIEEEKALEAEKKLYEKLKKEEELKKRHDFKVNFINSKVIELSEYKEVYELSKNIGIEIEELLEKHQVDYISSNNKSFIFSKDISYKKFDKDYFNFFMYNIDVNYIGGRGKFDLIIDKEFHKDLKADIKENYIALMYDIYKEFNPLVKEEDFINQLDEAITKCRNGAYNAIITGENSSIVVSKKDTVIDICMKVQKEIKIEPLTLTIKEYDTIKEFEEKNENLFNNNKNQNKALLKNLNYRYTYLYESFMKNKFSEDIGFKFRQINKYKDYGTTTSSTLNGKVVKIDNSTYEYLDELIEKFKLDFGFYIGMYMDKNQFADEIQKIALRENVFENDEVNDRFDLNLEPTLPIPGFLELTIEDDIITFKMKRDVIAEGITTR